MSRPPLPPFTPRPLAEGAHGGRCLEYARPRALREGLIRSPGVSTVASQHAVLREIHRVVRPGGQLRLIEHVRADSPGWRRAQRLLDMTIWPAVCGGDHTGRDTAAAVRAAGFTIELLDRFRFPDMRLTLPTSPHLSAIASRTP